MVLRNIKEFIRLESAGGILLLVAAILVMVAENSVAKGLYGALLATRVELRIGEFEIAKPFLLWINDGLMAIFFIFFHISCIRDISVG